MKGETWINVRSRQEEGWIRLSDIRLNRTLEINFVDVGQGDGCHLVTPTDEHFIIDAGEGDNMYRFLRWRFNLKKAGAKLPKFTAIMSHPDQDHWKGFEPLLSKIPEGQARQIEFSKMYHNGILQRTGSQIGEQVKKGKITYLKDFIKTDKEVKKLLEAEGAKSNLEKCLIGAFENFPKLKLETTYKEMGKQNIMYDDGTLSLEILAPIPEQIDGRLMLRWFGDLKQAGKTKNGHSVVLVARIGRMRILLGGDLNTEAADYLMSVYGGEEIEKLRVKLEAASDADRPALQQRMDKLIATGKTIFEAEIAKSCHHGSSDITNEFLQAINPIATVISSGRESTEVNEYPLFCPVYGYKFEKDDQQVYIEEPVLKG